MSNNQRSDFADVVESMPAWLPWTKRNFRMQYRLAKHTLVPWLERLHVLPRPARVIEIGCAEGGVLSAFVERGTTLAVGTDIMDLLLTTISTPIAEKLGLDITYSHHDVIYENPLPEWTGVFDVVILRDVIEHLDDATIALRNISRLLAPGGVVLVTFPPYTSAFGGHQQLLGTKSGGIPFVHLLPKSLFMKLVARGGAVNAEEVRRLHRIRLSAMDVRHAAADSGLDIVDERYFMLRPVFRWKYNKPIPTVDISWLRWFPPVRALAMEAAFVLRKKPA